MTPQPQSIQLTVDEALAFQQMDARLQGFLEGAQAAVTHFKRLRVQEMVAARTPAPPPPPPDNT